MKTIRQSTWAEFFQCPKRFELAMDHQRKQSIAMVNGKILDGFVFGFQSEEEKSDLIQNKAVKKEFRIKESAKRYQDIAETIKKNLGNGTPHLRYFANLNDDVQLTGELDWLGEYKGKNCILDLKFTGDIARVWDTKQFRHEFFQSVFYPFLHWTNTGQILPFVYLIIEENDGEFYTREIGITATQNDFEWLTEQLAMIWHLYSTGQLHCEESVCLGQYRSDGRCPYLQHCETGRKQIERNDQINFSDLA
jgi:hypothetical protein